MPIVLFETFQLIQIDGPFSFGEMLHEVLDKGLLGLEGSA